MKKLTPYQTKKYDIDQKIVWELADLESRQMLFSIVRQSKKPADISSATKIPPSTVYSKLKTLNDLSLAYVEKTELEDGHKIKYFKSRIKGAYI